MNTHTGWKTDKGAPSVWDGEKRLEGKAAPLPPVFHTLPRPSSPAPPLAHVAGDRVRVGGSQNMGF